MEANGKTIWFPAKKQGWGWGAPCAWQGWVTFGTYILSIMAAAFLLERGYLGLWMLTIAITSTAFFSIVWLKGEKPHSPWKTDSLE